MFPRAACPRARSPARSSAAMDTEEPSICRIGSVARGESGPESDLDILVEMEPSKSLLDHVALMQDLEDLLQRKVDVVSERALHWYIRDKVLAEAISL